MAIDIDGTFNSANLSVDGWSTSALVGLLSNAACEINARTKTDCVPSSTSTRSQIGIFISDKDLPNMYNSSKKQALWSVL